MAHLVSLHKTAHQHLRVNTKKAEAQGAGLNMVPVMLSEFLKLAVQYPIAFTKNKETGRFVCVAMFGFSAGENLFWKDNGWDSLYTPLHVARQPFFLGTNTDSDSTDENRFVICIDTESESVQNDHGEALFDAQGNETDYLEKTKSILAELLDGETKIQHFIDTLLNYKLLQAMRFEITFANEESTSVEGMYTINEERLNALHKDELFELMSLGYLKYIYIMVTSLGHLYSLINKKNARLS